MHYSHTTALQIGPLSNKEGFTWPVVLQPLWPLPPRPYTPLLSLLPVLLGPFDVLFLVVVSLRAMSQNSYDDEEDGDERGSYSPRGMPSSSSRSLLQLSASISAYLTRSPAQSWFHRLTWYWVDWKVRSSSRIHSLTKTLRLCCWTIDSLSYKREN